MENFKEFNQQIDHEVQKNKRKFIPVTIFTSILSFILGIVVVVNVVGVGKLNTNDEYLNKFLTIYEMINENWYFVDQEEDNYQGTYMDRAIKALVSQNIDSYLYYTPAPDYTIPPTFGIGVSAKLYDGYLFVTDVFRNSPADQAGVVKGDWIYEVDDVSIRYMNMNEISEKIKGEKNSKVQIKVLRNQISHNFIITRNDYEEQVVFSSSVDRVGILRITSFNNFTVPQARLALNELTNQSFPGGPIEHLIVDLRNNPGGKIEAMVGLADLFLPKNKTVITIKKLDGEIERYATSTNAEFSFSRIGILANEDSASASEGFAGAMKENLSNCISLGVTTYGKGIAQMPREFFDHSSLTYTFGEWFTPKGNKVHKIGIAPEVILTQDILTTGTDNTWSNATLETVLTRLNYTPINQTELIQQVYDAMQESLSKIDLSNEEGVLAIYETMRQELEQIERYKVRSMLKDFQKKEGLDVHGDFDRPTYERINKYLSDSIDELKSFQLLKTIQYIKEGSKW